MPRKTYTPEQIIRKLREAEVFIAEGMTTVEAARKIGVAEQTYYRWRKEYGGMQVEQARRLKGLEKENARLKRLVAEKELDIQILREALAYDSKNCCARRRGGGRWSMSVKSYPSRSAGHVWWWEFNAVHIDMYQRDPMMKPC
jgi:putative transposase